MTRIAGPRWRGMFLFAACAVAGAAHAETPAEPPEQLLGRLLDENREALAVSAQGIEGAGAKALLDAARTAQFVLIGEDHGFQEVPQFVLALKRSLGRDAPANLAVEAGPLATQHFANAARDNTLPALAARYPAAIAFFGWRGDGDMLSAWQRGQTQQTVWGLDQEFLLSTRLHAERLHALSAEGPARQHAAAFLERAKASEATVFEKHDLSAALLPQLSEQDFAELRTAVGAGSTGEAATLIDELAQSAAIYRANESAPHDSNLWRAQMMKRHFMHDYRAAQARGDATPRVLFRLGAYHAGRGLSPTNQFDIGNLASELAASNGRESLHVLVLTAAGTVNRWLPFVADTASRTATYNATEELASMEVMPFVEHANKEGWSLFRTEALRRSRAARLAGGRLFERAVFAYDYVVVMPHGTAAIEYDAAP